MINRVPYIIWWAILVHITWGIALIIEPAIAPLAILVGLHWILALGISETITGITLITAAILAACSMMLGNRLSRQNSLLMLLPQYSILIAAFISDLQSIITGNVAGREVDHLVLFTVLAPLLIAAILHTIAIIERYLAWTPPKLIQ